MCCECFCELLELKHFIQESYKILIVKNGCQTVSFHPGFRNTSCRLRAHSFCKHKKNGRKNSDCIKDNGKGIPQKTLDKIFQPFFTTKQTGEGTGLGLSLSYDIVKVHEGNLEVESKEGEITEFLISLPA